MERHDEQLAASSNKSGVPGVDNAQQETMTEQSQIRIDAPRRRVSGILLHPTSLPGVGGIGDLGDEAYRFVDWLASAKQQRWQIMPLGPTSYGDSPYQCLSALAGNPLLISLQRLVSEGMLSQDVLNNTPDFPVESVDYGPLIEWKTKVLQSAYANFSATARREQRQAFEDFHAEQASWLDNYALFTAIKEAHGGAAWSQWDRSIARREADALAQWRTRLADRIRFQQFVQWLFFSQWLELKAYANAREVQIVGDIPIFVAHDSVDVWAHPELFYLDEEGNPSAVAGVPPDYFSATGQRWGNPLYRWDVLAERGYDWWIERFRMTLTLVDIVRLDHFRGFSAYWEVPAEEATAVKGRWVKGPGLPFFEAIRSALGRLPIIAEDLGVITPEVDALREESGFPGMAVLQMAWDDNANVSADAQMSEDTTFAHLPHNHHRDRVVYTGTHDNDTVVGWWHTASDGVRSDLRQYLGIPCDDIAWDLIRVAFMSVAETAIIPMQDVLSLGSEARMNLPGHAAGNWVWRLLPNQLTPQVAERLALLTTLYDRAPREEETPQNRVLETRHSTQNTPIGDKNGR